MFVVFDIETTGLSTTTNDIIQFAYCMFDSNNQFVKAENLYFYYEGMSWSQEAADASHHLSLEFLKQYEADFEKNILKMYSVLNRCNVIGHNSDSFDCPFVKNWLARRGLEDFAFGIQQDTMKAFKPVTKRARVKLTKLAEMLGCNHASINYFAEVWFGQQNIRGPHDAAYDVAMTAIITLQGIAKNLIAFNPIVVDQVADNVDYDDYDEITPEVNLPIDPKAFIVMYQTHGSDIVQYHCFNHDRELYRDIDIALGATDEDIRADVLAKYKGKLLDLVLKQTDQGYYASEHKGVTYELWLDKNDKLCIKTPYLTISSEETDVIPILQHNFGTEG